VASEFYTRDEIADDFKLIKELLNQYESLHNFIINLILDPVVDMHKGKNPKVILTTIHSAKGLEFDQVYYFHTHDWYRNYDLEKLEEDRRLFYVGISRAKHQLYIFDHTEFKRDFESILRDFENGTMIQEPVKKEKPVASKQEMMSKFKSLRKTLH
jgi:superfamily I DNA/RNA helicase